MIRARSPHRVVVLALAAAAVGVALAAPGSGAGVAAAAVGEPQVRCRLSDDRLTEVSGITWSPRHPGTYWVHNDSGGGPYLYAIDGRTCATRARVRVEGIDARDLEALATGVAPGGEAVLWLGDIGDNNDSWDSVRLHAIREPARLVDATVGATTYEFTYADRPHDAEAILADPDAPTVWVATKQLATGAVWEVPLRTDEVARAEQVARVRGLVTDAAYAPDGSSYVLRDYLSASLHPAPVSAQTLGEGVRVDLPAQQQGEAITYTDDGTALLVVSEGSPEVWEVPLPSSATASPDASPEPTGDPSGEAPAAPTPSAGPGLAAYVAAGLAALAGIGVAILGARRLRH